MEKPQAQHETPHDEGSSQEPDAAPPKCMGLLRKTLERLLPLVAPGEVHGNEEFHLEHAVSILLCCFYNPAARSLRLIEALSQDPHCEGMTPGDRAPRTTLSDALCRFDPERLLPLIAHLRAQLPALRRFDPDLEKVTRQLVIQDGSYFNLAGEVAWAMTMSRGPGSGPIRQVQGGEQTQVDQAQSNAEESNVRSKPPRGHRTQSRVRLNLQIEVESHLPVDLDVSGGDDGSEAGAFMRKLEPDRVYIVDRNFVHFGYVNAVLAAGSSLVLRLRKDTGFDVQETRPLCERDRELLVISDEFGRLSGSTSPSNHGRASRTALPPKQALRRVIVWDAKNKKQVVLLSDILDVPAYVIALLYRRRWEIELFLRWLKVLAGMEHLLNFSRRGITLQFYVAVIATLILYLRTGRRPGKYELYALGRVTLGGVPLESFGPWLAMRQRERERDRVRYAKKRAAQKDQ